MPSDREGSNNSLYRESRRENAQKKLDDLVGYLREQVGTLASGIHGRRFLEERRATGRGAVDAIPGCCVVLSSFRFVFLDELRRKVLLDVVDADRVLRETAVDGMIDLVLESPVESRGEAWLAHPVEWATCRNKVLHGHLIQAGDALS